MASYQNSLCSIAGALVLLIGISVRSEAQEFPKHEVSAGFGILASPVLASFFDDFWQVKGNDPYTSDIRASGAFFGGHQYDVKENIALGVFATHLLVTEKYDYTLEPDIRERTRFIGIMAQGKLTWHEEPGFSFYTTFGIGRKLVLRETFTGNIVRNTQFNEFALQFTPVGIRFGGMLGGFVEVGYGIHGIARGGMSLQF
ncbi:MAG: hypothetical protein IPI23_00505 [Bacteroidetes bacterium]|nr:hypothetical protein [Bacteroidota bacterium]